jgi:hypothetical protein
MRDAGCPKPRDVLPTEKLNELLALWRARLKSGEYPPDTCQRMVSMYEIRLHRLGVNCDAPATSATD